MSFRASAIEKPLGTAQLNLEFVNLISYLKKISQQALPAAGRVKMTPLMMNHKQDLIIGHRLIEKEMEESL